MIDPAVAAILAIGGMFALLAVGVPVAIALGAAGFAGLALIGGWSLAFSQIQAVPFNITANYEFAVVPTFIFMGNLAMAGGMARELYDAADKWLGHYSGGQFLTTIVGSTSFAAASGSTLANATVFTRIALPEMIRLGYSKGVACACIAAAGTLAAMIPPSVAMVVYGIITEQSIGKLMIAGIVPGIISAFGYCILVIIMVRLRPHIAPRKNEPATWRDAIIALRGTWAIGLLFLLIMGGIYAGYFSPSAAGAVGAFGALAILALRRRLSLKSLNEAIMSSALTSAMLFIIIIGGMIFSRMLVMSGVVGGAVEMVGGWNLSPVMLTVCLSVLYIILGCFIDALSMLLVTLPFVFPIVQGAHLDPIWFGILVVQFLEIGAITPPVGLNLFAVVSAADGVVTIEDIMRGIMPFILLNFILLGLFIAFPALVVWLPAHMTM